MIPGGFPSGSVVKNPPANAGDASLIPGSGRSPGEDGRQPIPVFLPGKANGQRRWQATAHGITESDRTERQRESLKQKFSHEKVLGCFGNCM